MHVGYLIPLMAFIIYVAKVWVHWIYLKAEREGQLSGYSLWLLLKVILWEGQNPAQHSKKGNGVVEGLNGVLFEVLLPYIYWPKKSDLPLAIRWRLGLMALSFLPLVGLLLFGLQYGA